MKKILIFLTIFLFFATPVLAEQIQSFNVQIKINSNSAIEVREDIFYDFEGLQRHGIYREIPYKYTARGGNYNLRIFDIEVYDENGDAMQTQITTSNGYLKIRIGDPDVLITGRHIYTITYKVMRAINFFDNHDELYWNLTGNEWEVDINSVSAKVTWPKTNAEVSVECYSGPAGSTQTCLNKLVASDAAYFQENILPAGSGLTAVIGLPKGLIQKPSFWQNITWILQDNGILLAPIFVLIFMYLLWRKKGKDPLGDGTIIAQYSAPDNLTPAEVGGLVDEKVHSKDVSAEIIHLAVQGYLTITKINGEGVFKKDDYQLNKLKDENDLPNNFQKYLMRSLFESGDEIKLSKLKNKFYDDWQQVVRQIYDSLVAKKYFPHSPKKIIGIYVGIGAAIIFLGFNFLVPFFGTLSIISLILSGLIIIIFGFFMPVKTQAGVIAKEKILGFKEYLSVVETDRLKFHNAPEKNPQTFEKFLPYAMALGVEKDWAKKFENIYTGSPAWYTDSANAHFSAWYLANSLNNFSTNTNTSLSSRPSSAAGGGSGFSGGFSGGGFGGGGGGSW